MLGQDGRELASIEQLLHAWNFVSLFHSVLAAVV